MCVCVSEREIYIYNIYIYLFDLIPSVTNYRRNLAIYPSFRKIIQPGKKWKWGWKWKLFGFFWRDPGRGGVGGNEKREREERKERKGGEGGGSVLSSTGSISIPFIYFFHSLLLPPLPSPMPLSSPLHPHCHFPCIRIRIRVRIHIGILQHSYYIDLRGIDRLGDPEVDR